MEKEILTPIKKFPKTIKIYYEVNNPDMIDIPVEFKAAKKEDCSDLESITYKNKEYYSYWEYNKTNDFDKNYFQIIKNSTCLRDRYNITPYNKDNIAYETHLLMNEFFTNIGRAISVGEKKKEKNTYALDGLLSPLFNAKIDTKGKIKVKKKEYKLVIFYTSTYMKSTSGKMILINRPSSFFEKYEKKDVENKGDMYLTFVGKFTATLEEIK